LCRIVHGFFQVAYRVPFVFSGKQQGRAITIIQGGIIRLQAEQLGIRPDSGQIFLILK
jgi:hypothetical protein